MKKTIISLILILFNLFAVNIAYCEEDFFIDTNFVESKNKIKFPSKKEKEETNQKIKKINFFKKDDGYKNQTKFNYTTNQKEEIPRGYYGSLPDIEADFKYKEQEKLSPQIYDLNIPKAQELNENNLKAAPYQDPLFLDVIIKKDKTSNYVNDIQRTKFALNNLKKCIEEQGDIQRFNACVNNVDLYVKNLKNKYQDLPESKKASYNNILTTVHQSKVLGNLKYDAMYYSRYVPLYEGQYSKDNIYLQEQKLLDKINNTLYLINNES